MIEYEVLRFVKTKWEEMAPGDTYRVIKDGEVLADPEGDTLFTIESSFLTTGPDSDGKKMDSIGFNVNGFKKLIFRDKK